MIALVPHAPAAGWRARSRPQPSPRPRQQPVIGVQLLAIDSVLRRLAAARNRLLPASERAACEIVSTQAWFTFGYARATDFARERWGRTGRWLLDRAALGNLFRCFPRLEQAATGEDDGAPIGSVAALLVGRVATAETLDHWIARAREITVRALRSEVSSADRAPREPEPVSLRLRMPGPIRVAFEAAWDLHCAVVGRNAGVAEFVEALIAESSAGVLVEELAPDRIVSRAAVPSNARFEARDAWPVYVSPAFQAALDCLARVECWTSEPSEDVSHDGIERLSRCEGAIRELLRLEDEIETRIGALLAELDEHRAWRSLGCEDVAAYGEKYLGLSETTAWRRATIVRRLRGLQEIRRSYLDGMIGIEAADTIQRALGERASVATQQEWLARARGATLKRLHDESMAASHARLLGANESEPPTEKAWYESRRRIPGLGLAEIIAAGCRVLDAIGACSSRPDVFLQVRLPLDAARDFEAAIEDRRRAVAEEAERLDVLPVQIASRARPSLRIANLLRRRHQGVPAWVGVLALLEEYACTWDTSPRRAGDATYERAGYRCEAPGCTSRRNLEAHHVRYRSHGGGSDPENLACLCRMHHQMGEHGGRARVRGRAPLGIVWRLGVPRVATWFRNEMRLAPVG